MTREDARKIIFENMKSLEGSECQGLVDAIEALGLIKFDKDEKIWYQSENDKKWGTIRISEYEDKLFLWVGGHRRFVLGIKDVI